MKRLLWLVAFVLPLHLAMATDWQLVIMTAPVDESSLTKKGLELYHRAGDYWLVGAPAQAQLPAGSRKLEAYHSDGGEVFRLLLASPEEITKLEGKVTILYSDADEAIIQATPDQLSDLPAIRAEWIRISLVPKPFGYYGIEHPATDDFHPMVQEFVNQVSQVQYTEYIQTLEDFVTRNTYTANCNQAASWIIAQFQGFGLDAYVDEFSIGGNTRYNVIGELIGLVHPDSIIFITAHYDATAGSPWSPEPVAPGADDNGSGTACFLECARILSTYNFEKTIRFVGFAGEEQGLYGSEDYVQDLLNAGTIVVGCFNYDMIAYSGNDPLPPDLVIYTDNNPRSQAMANKIAEAIVTFVPTGLEPDIDVDPSMGSSDHGPFWDAGMPAICGIEEQAWGPEFNPWYHSVNDLVVNCDLEYATNCTRAAIAALADYAVPIEISGPYLTVSDKEFDEIIGNGNQAPDPGETISILVTLVNVGSEPATSIAATLTTTDPYLTITQNSASYPDLIPQATGTASQPYIIEISSSCPNGAWVSTTLEITAAGGYENSVPINFVVGDPKFEPTGPDSYGYLAYDPFDEPEYPVYDWVEICADSGGPGTLVNFTQDDQTFQFDMPFDFGYYGISYNRYTIGANGWIGMGDILEDDYSNSGIPDGDGPAPMIALYWEDLSPQRTNSGRVWRWYDEINHRLIVEYNHVEQYSPTGSFETFQVILLDPVYYPTATNDGQILFQYKDMSSSAQSEGTVGIEDHSETDGLQYLYDGGYDPHAHSIEDGFVIFFTPPTSVPDLTVSLTPYGTPIQIPASGGSFNFNIAVANNGTTGSQADIWCDVTLPGGSHYGPTIGPVNLFLNPGFFGDRDRTQNVPAAAPAGMYSYNGYIGVYPNTIWDEDNFPFEKLSSGDGGLVEDWFCTGESFEDWMLTAYATPLPTENSLGQNFPNPFNPTTALSYKLQASSFVDLSVYDIAGREVAELINGWRKAGTHEVIFDGTGLASGVYVYRLQAGEFTGYGKMILLK